MVDPSHPNLSRDSLHFREEPFSKEVMVLVSNDTSKAWVSGVNSAEQLTVYMLKT